MKRTIYVLLLWLLLFFWAIKGLTLAQTGFFGEIIDTETGKFKCGIAGGEDDQDKCCVFDKGEKIFFDVPESVPDPFGVKSKYEEIKKSLEELRKGANKPCLIGVPNVSDVTDPNCRCVYSLTPTPVAKIENLCNLYLNDQEKEFCKKCAQEKGGIWTAIGCVPLRFNVFITRMLQIGIGFAGVVALFCIVYSAISLQLSQGNPEKIKKSQELLTSCVIGLLVVIFSLFILRVIGVDILRLPRFK